MRSSLISIAVTVLNIAIASFLLMAGSSEAEETSDMPSGMLWIPGGEFTMGSEDPLARPRENPPHRVKVDGFFMDTTPVTNAQFRAFVKATGYVTTAEKPADLAEIMKQFPPGTPEPPPEALEPASIVFTPPFATSAPEQPLSMVELR